MKKFKDLKSFVIIVFSIAVALCLVFGLLWNVKFPLDTFPNNMYNSILKCERIDYRYSFLSDSTNQIFNSKIENIK